jgi:hypothetical protein
MPKADRGITVYPVPGFYVLGVPAVPTTTTPEEAESLVSTGAFTYEPPPAAEAAPDAETED